MWINSPKFVLCYHFFFNYIWSSQSFSKTVSALKVNFPTVHPGIIWKDGTFKWSLLTSCVTVIWNEIAPKRMQYLSHIKHIICSLGYYQPVNLSNVNCLFTNDSFRYLMLMHIFYISWYTGRCVHGLSFE